MATNKDFKVKNGIRITNGEGFKSTNVAGGTRTLIKLDTDNVLKIKGNDSEGSANAINVTAGANVGIGVTPSGSRFQIKGSTSDTSANALQIRDSSNASLFSIRNDGRVDIPQGAVHITSTLNTGATTIKQTGSGGSTVLLNVGNTENGQIKTRHIEGKDYDSTDNGILHLNYYGSTDISMVAGGGNVKIGSGSANEKLEVAGIVRSNGYKIGSTTICDVGRNLTNIGTITSGAITVNNQATGDQRHLFIDGYNAEYDFRSNSASGYRTTFNMNNNGLQIGHDSSSRSLALRTAGTDRLTINGNGTFSFNSNNLSSIGTISSGLITTSAGMVVTDTTTNGRGIYRNNSGYDLRLGGGTDRTTGAYISISGDQRGGTNSAYNGRVEFHTGGVNASDSSSVLGDFHWYASYNGGSTHLLSLDSVTGDLDLKLGGLEISSTTVIDASRNANNFVQVSGETIGVKNTSSTSKKGISLYGSAGSGTDPSFGIMFTGTAGSGTHGGVTGNWATYFTMDNQSNRGWIFRNKGNTTNVASITNTGNATFNGAITSTGINNATGEIIDLDNPTYTILKNPENSACLYMGDAGDRNNYYDNTNHHFRPAGGGSTINATISATSINARNGSVFAIDGTTVISASRNLTNIGSISTSDHIRIADNKKLLMGSGDMFQIGHITDHSQITTYEGDLYIDQNADDKDIIFRSDNGSGGITDYIRLDGSHGQIKLNKQTIFSDSVEATFGTSGDAGIYHNGTHLYIDEKDAGRIFIRSSNEIRLNKYTGEYMLRAISDGAVELYHNNSKKFETTSSGVSVSGAISTSANLDMNANNIIDVEQINGTGGTGWLDFNMDTDNIYPTGTTDNLTVLGSITHHVFVGDSNGNGTGGNFYWGYGVDKDDSGTFTETMALTRAGNLTVHGTYIYTSGDIRVGTSTGATNQTGIIKHNGTTFGLGLFNWGDANPIFIGGSEVNFRTETGASIPLKSNGTTFLDSSRNLTNIGTISCGAITSSGDIKTTSDIWVNYNASGNEYLHLNYASGGDGGILFRHANTLKWQQTAVTGSGQPMNWYSYDASDTVMSLSSGGLLTTDSGYQVNGTTVIDSSRNITGTTITGAQFKWNTDSAGTNYLGTDIYDGLVLHSRPGESIFYGSGETSSSVKAHRFYTGTTSNSALGSEVFSITAGGDSVFAGSISSGSITATGGDSYFRHADNIGIRLQTTAQGTTNSDGLRVGLNSTHAFVWQFENKPLAFATNGTERLTISQAGTIGIGDSNPPANTKLAIQGDGIGIRLDGTANTTRSIFFRNTTSSNPAEVYADGSLRLRTEDAGTSIQFQTNDTTALTLTSSQNATFTGDITFAGQIKSSDIQGDSAIIDVASSPSRIRFGALADDDIQVQIVGFGGSSDLTFDDGEATYTGSYGELLNFKVSTSTRGSIGSRSEIANNIFMETASGTSAIGFKISTYAGSSYLAPSQDQGAIADNQVRLGFSSNRYVELYAVDGSINTSDRNEKQDIQELTDAEQRVALTCKGLIRRYKWNHAVEQKGDDARYHFGIIAQDLQQAFTDEGLDASNYGLFTLDTWENEDGTEETRLGVRYNELLAFIISAI